MSLVFLRTFVELVPDPMRAFYHLCYFQQIYEVLRGPQTPRSPIGLPETLRGLGRKLMKGLQTAARLQKKLKIRLIKASLLAWAQK